MTKLNAPLLWRIDVRKNKCYFIGNNLINSLRPFARIYWPKLAMLVIGKNRIIEVGDVWQLDAPILGWVDL